MKKLFILFLFSIHFLSGTSANVNLDSLLSVLDETILNNQVFLQKKMERIAGLNERLKHLNPISEDCYELNMKLYQEYKAFICDSAIHYLDENIQLAGKMNDEDRKNASQLELSYLLSSSGMYKEAVDVLDSINRSILKPQQLVSYYTCFDRAYGELGYYTQHKAVAGYYWQIAQLNKDSLYMLLDPQSDEYLILQETLLRDDKKYEAALKLNDTRLEKAVFGTPQYALVTYYRSLIYNKLNDKEQEMGYLALSAISDIKSATKDHASLWMLAKLLYEAGDVERAYHYMRFSWSDTKFYNARLRSWQSADVLSLIDKTYQAMIEKQNNRLELYIILISVLLFLFIAALVYIYRQMKRLSVARNHLQTANDQLNKLNEDLRQMNLCLQSTNVELSESNQIKEEYIARFVKLCSTYINKLDSYRRMVSKKLSDGRIAEILKITRSQDAMDAELEELYANFDTAFLHIFPDFVKKFNALLLPDDQIVLKRGELLNTELRIFALIRLGIEDSSQIAEFLRYSVNTIYNYRSKVKNRAGGSREEFEEQVKAIR